MGKRMQMCYCLDCKDEHSMEDHNPMIDDLPYQFMIKMEHMTKEELIDHIEETECPDCGSDNWQLTDYSVI